MGDGLDESLDRVHIGILGRFVRKDPLLRIGKVGWKLFVDELISDNLTQL